MATEIINAIRLLAGEARRRDPICVEHRCTPRQLARIFEHIESTWSDMGQTDPMYSVFSADRFRNANANEENIKEFFASGRLDTDALASELTGHGLPASGYTHCVELGCGLGRVTRYLSGFAKNVTGYDISEPHLKLASEHIANMGIQNVALKKISTLSSLKFKPFDLFYSRLVFQHNPPPIIYHMLDIVLQSLTPGGVAVFQLPAYIKGYEFSIKTYLSSMQEISGQELHVLPLSIVSGLLQTHNCTLVNTYRDSCLSNTNQVSMHYVVRKSD